MSVLKAALEAAGISIREYNPNKVRAVKTSRGAAISVDRFCSEIQKILGKRLIDHPEVMAASMDDGEMTALIEEYAVQELGAAGQSSGGRPAEVADLTLNVDTSSSDPGLKKFFCTTKEEVRDPSVSGQHYLAVCGFSTAEGSKLARPVVPRYMPRSSLGIHEEVDTIVNRKRSYLNTYIPPRWKLLEMRDPATWKKIPDKAPEVVIRMLKHIIPNQEERNYFYAWLYTSITSRSFVYLVLCGSPGVGKNRLKLLINAIHGEHNTTDGKKETLGANQSKFNSQVEDTTLVWFDELKYGPDMEPRMKEYQNSTVSIEKKGQDASRSTQIYCSMVISNNYPRDNYILFNSRKFAPLVLGSKKLDEALTADEIGEVSAKLDPESPNYDVKFVAQITKWIMKIGQKHATNPRWPNLEYQGPMYWHLAHTSMSRWQKISVLALTTENKRGPLKGWNAAKKAFKWSEVEAELRSKKEFDLKDYRDSSTVRAFFETYRDISGSPVFEVESVPQSVIQDFWVKPIGGLVKRDITISLNNGQEHILNQPVRPPGMSDFQWNKMKAEHRAIQEGFASVRNEQNEDLDLL